MMRMRVFDQRMKRLDISYTSIIGRVPEWKLPCLHRRGYKGMWNGMLKSWRTSRRTCTRDWLLLLESDAILPFHFMKVASRILVAPTQIVWFDARVGMGRSPSGCCTNVVAYHKSIWNELISQFNPHNPHAFWNHYETRSKGVVKDPTCLTDWYLGNVASHLRWRARRHGIVPHGRSKSEIGYIDQNITKV